jgi:tellurite resistance protein TerC
VTVPGWAWATFLAFVIALLVLDVFVLHRRAHEVSSREAGVWSAVWIVIGLGFGGLVWAWAGSGPAQAYRGNGRANAAARTDSAAPVGVGAPADC